MEPGQELLHYRLIEKIGEGGMGVVWKAIDTTLDREVAIKVLPELFTADTERLARFEREAKLLASLNHANIAAVYGFHQADSPTGSLRFIAMELVDGEDLAERLTRGAVPIDESLRIAAQLAEALEAAHEAGVIHRDLKPANIKLTPDDRVKVLDFGLAKAFDAAGLSSDASMSPTVTSAGTMAGTILGTAAYMSPEQARGRAVDSRADIWAFGCVLYEILSGVRPFTGESISDTLAAVLKFEPDHDQLPRELPSSVRRLLRRCLTKQPRQRLQAIGEARIALEECISGSAADDVDASGMAKAATAKPRAGSIPSWLLAAGVVVGLVVGAALGWNMQPAAPQPITRFPLDLAGELKPFDAMALSPDGRRLVYAANGRLYQHAMDRMLPTPIPGTEEGTQPFFSPDGNSVAFFTPTQLRRVDLDGTPPTTLAEVKQGVVGDWDTNGNIFFGQSGPFPLFRVAASGGTPEIFVELGDYGDLDYPDVLPGEEWVLFTALASDGYWNDARIMAKSIKTGTMKTVLAGGHFARYLRTGHLVFGREGTLFAVEFDVERVETVGVPVPVVEHVYLNGMIGGNGFYAVSDYGTLAFVHREEGKHVLALADRSGRVERLDVPPQPYVYARVSPDGTRVVAETRDRTGKSRLWLYELSGETALRPLLQGIDATSPVWTPDGRQLIFASKIEGTSGVWVQSVDGGTGPVLWATLEEESSYLRPEFSLAPDGSALIFVRPENGNTAIWSASEPGAEPEFLLSNDGGTIGGPVFSPDARWVAYWSTKGSAALTAAIHATPFPRSGDVYATLEEVRFFPVWSPDGKEVIYTTVTGELFSRSVSTSGAFAFGPERLLAVESLFFARARGFDVLPDGERFLVIVPSEAVAPRFHVVLNWFEEFEERMSGR